VGELLERPEKALGLPPDVAAPLFVQVSALAAALSTAAARPAALPVPLRERAGDRLLGPDDVSARIGKSRSWVEKHPGELPPRRRVGGEALWSEREIEAWIRNLPRWDD
jgi:predicted DNA-binding transcriptional regulator AlpA